MTKTQQRNTQAKRDEVNGQIVNEVAENGKSGDSDELDACHIFSNTDSRLLAGLLKGGFDLNDLARIALVNRGLGKNAEWVGFDKAAKVHG